MPSPPIAARKPYTVKSPHGEREDPYYWLRDDERKDPEMLAYLAAENAYTKALLAPTEALQETIYSELVARIAPDDESVPYRERGYYYAQRYEAGREYGILERTPADPKGERDPEAAKELVLDQNTLAEGTDYFALGGWDVSPDNTKVAYGTDTLSRRMYTIRVRDIASQEDLEDEVPNTNASVVWAADQSGFFYVEKDQETLLGERVKFHRLGTPSGEDRLVYEEKDHSFYLGIGETGDRRYLQIHLSSTVSDELRFVDLQRVGDAPTVLLPRMRDHEYEADHIKGRWILRSNHQAKNFRLLELSDRDLKRAPEERLGQAKELFAHREDRLLEGFDLFREHIVLEERGDALTQLRVVKLAELGSGVESKGELLAAKDPAYAMGLHVNAEQDSTRLRYVYSSPVVPDTVYEFDMNSGEARQLKQAPVPGYDPSRYEVHRVWVEARDGVKIPVTLVSPPGGKKDGPRPIFQYGYGSYGASMDARFRRNILSLVDRGMNYAVAHIRGGQEMGRAWYEQGRQLQKRNTFYDFADVSEGLVKQGWAKAGKVAMAGGSAGGLLMGAVMNDRPDLYAAVVAGVPFVDVVTTMLDESIPLTTNEFDEWGNPKRAEFYRYMLSYSPYDQVSDQVYPPTLITTGLWDSQVQYFEPAKWTARLRHRAPKGGPYLLKTDMKSGHGGASGRFRSQKETALEYAFVLWQLGLDDSAKQGSE